MKILICPGIHPSGLTESFLAGLRQHADGQQSDFQREFSVLPSERFPVYSPRHILEFLSSSGQADFSYPLLFIAFSAGVVGAIGAARLWQKRGGTVKALIALDGWAVPLQGDFPIHRVSHDHLTHWSSAFFGSGSDSFYADPPVGHLALWRSPEATPGHWVASDLDPQRSSVESSLDSPLTWSPRHPVTAASFITALLQKYE